MKNRIIKIDKNVRFGKPCIPGTRIAITDMLNMIKRGYKVDDIPGQFENVTKEEAQAAIEYAISALNNEEIIELN